MGPFGGIGLGGGEEVDSATLHTLSDETGAKTYIIREIGDGEAIKRACLDISLELREQYTVGFVAPAAGSGGYRSVRVDVPGRSDAGVRVRKGVDVGSGGADYSSATP